MALLNKLEKTRADVNIENVHSQPILVEKFDALRESSGRDVYSRLTEIEPIFSTQNEYLESFQDALFAWNSVFDYETIINDLKSPSEIGRKRLKRIRRFGLILKSNYLSFDTHHSAPEELHFFLKALGNHNDYFEHENREKIALELMNSGIVEKLRDTKFTLELCSTESFRNYFDSVLREIITAISSESLPTPEFHDLRKNIRLLMNVFQSPAAHELGSPIHDLFLVLYGWSTVLGDLHDAVVQSSLDDAASYDSEMVLIPSEFKKELMSVLPDLIRSLGFPESKLQNLVKDSGQKRS